MGIQRYENWAVTLTVTIAAPCRITMATLYVIPERDLAIEAASRISFFCTF